MSIIRLGVLTVVSFLAGVLAIYKDREYIPQLTCSIVGVFREIDYCRALIMRTNNKDDELAVRRKREAQKEAEAAEQRRVEADQRAKAAEAARRQAEEEAYAERRRKREAEKDAEEAEERRREAEQRARAAEAARQRAESAATQSSMTQEYPGPQQSSSYWLHNSSLVMMIAKGTSVRLVYENPRQGMREEGVTRGTLLFEGTANGNAYDGTAYVFSGRCGAAFPYPVTGDISPDGAQVRLFGKAPNRIGPDCRVMGYRDDSLIFDRRN